MKPSIGVIGGTGPAGSSLAVRFASLGHAVVIGSRDAGRAAAVVAEHLGRYPAELASLSGAENAVAAECEMVVIATPWDSAEATALAHASALSGKVVISMVNALYKQGRNINALVLPRGSMAEHLGACLVSSTVVGAFHHVPAKDLGAIEDPLALDVLVCSDDPAASAKVIDLANEIPGTRGIDAGNLSAALAIEAMTAVLINVNIRYKTRTSLQLSGIRES